MVHLFPMQETYKSVQSTGFVSYHLTMDAKHNTEDAYYYIEIHDLICCLETHGLI